MWNFPDMGLAELPRSWNCTNSTRRHAVALCIRLPAELRRDCLQRPDRGWETTCGDRHRAERFPDLRVMRLVSAPCKVLAVLYVPICVNLFLSLFYYLFLKACSWQTPKFVSIFPLETISNVSFFKSHRFLESHTLMNKCTKSIKWSLFFILDADDLRSNRISPVLGGSSTFSSLLPWLSVWRALLLESVASWPSVWLVCLLSYRILWILSTPEIETRREFKLLLQRRLFFKSMESYR